jgi:hypothetical protein
MRHKHCLGHHFAGLVAQLDKERTILQSVFPHHRRFALSSGVGK